MLSDLAESSPGQLLELAIDHKRLAHALLVYGQSLGQVETFATALAAKLLDVAAAGDDLEERLLRHPDVFTLRPSKKSRIISVDDTREVIRAIQHSPQRGYRKVALVYEVDRFHVGAANAFLKTLEEPPLNTTILLLTTRPHSLLATIRSRCQRFRLPSSLAEPSDPRVAAWLATYRKWLDDVLEKRPTGKAAVPHYVIGLYGLVERYRDMIEKRVKEAWKEQSKNLPEDLVDEERIALESRIAISLRQQFLAQLEGVTQTLAREKLAENASVSEKFVESIHALEEANNLLRLNMRTEAALEIYLLQALRIWSA